MVKGIPFNPNDPEVSGPDIFKKLVPLEVHKASSLYRFITYNSVTLPALAAESITAVLFCTAFGWLSTLQPA